jgi:hypothetical protein
MIEKSPQVTIPAPDPGEKKFNRPPFRLYCSHVVLAALSRGTLSFVFVP